MAIYVIFCSSAHFINRRKLVKQALKVAVFMALFTLVGLGNVVSTEPEPCIGVLGDSIAAGKLVLEDHNAMKFVVIQTNPFAVVLHNELAKLGDNTKVIDFSEGADALAFFNGDNHPSYRDSKAYQNALQEACLRIVILPFVNDVGIYDETTSPENAATKFTEDLANMVSEFEAVGAKQFYLVNYYHVQPAYFAKNIWPRLNNESLDIFRDTISDKCQTWSNISCQDPETVFVEIYPKNVVGETTMKVLRQYKFGPDKAQPSELFKKHKVLGDGVHLSQIGKEELAKLIAEVIFSNY